MKKLLVFVTILTLAGPALGMVCDCCPIEPLPVASDSVLSSPSCDCCPQAIQVDQKRQATSTQFQSFEILNRAFQLAIATIISQVEILDSGSSSDLVDSSPPPATSSPLYLTLQILRI
jgi:hypothetical protein